MSKPSTRPRQERLLLKRSALLLILLTTTLILSGACLERKNVTLQIGSQRETLTSYAFTVGQFLAGAGVTMGPLDRVEPGPDTELKDGTSVAVYRAVPVTVTADDTVRRLFTTRNTVAAVLAEAGVTLAGLDRVEPGLGSPVTADMQIKVLRVVSRQETREVTVPFTTLALADARLAGGSTNLLQAGQPGLARQVWHMVYTNGALTAATLVSEALLTAPKPAILAVTQTPEANRGGMPNLYTRQVTMLATAYAPTGNHTATGTVPEVGTIAVDPRVIPLGTRLYVQGYGYATALDTGGAIKGNRVDLFMDTEREASDWGVRDVQVYVLS
ncbi:MAG TPA: 3D domain-containing protein [Spirochaetia bacterium]|nr:3D domain-containing protein [Spirochaetia bacterium]